METKQRHIIIGLIWGIVASTAGAQPIDYDPYTPAQHREAGVKWAKRYIGAIADSAGRHHRDAFATMSAAPGVACMYENNDRTLIYCELGEFGVDLPFGMDGIVEHVVTRGPVPWVDGVVAVAEARHIPTRTKSGGGNTQEVFIRRPSADFHAAAKKLRQEQEQRDIAKLDQSCTLVGEANELLRGISPQRVWICPLPSSYEGSGVEVELDMVDVVVEDGHRILSRSVLLKNQGDGGTKLSARGALRDISGSEEPELLVEYVDECAARTVALLNWNERGELRELWSEQVQSGWDCGSGDDGIDYFPDPSWWPKSGSGYRTPKARLVDGRFSWAGEPMVWEEDSKRFVPSAAGLRKDREARLETARKLLGEGQPAVAFASLPEEPPEDLLRMIAAACEKAFLKALSDAKPVDGNGQEVSPSEFRALKAEMLRRGLSCAPKSQALKGRLESIQAQVKLDEKRASRQAAQPLKRKRIERFLEESLGDLKFGITRGEARSLCVEKNGRWDSGTNLGLCKYPSGVDFSAGFCGDRACSLHMVHSSPWSEDLGYHSMVRYYENRFGQGEYSKRGEADIVSWKLDAEKEITITLARLGGHELLSVALYSKGRR